MSEVVLTKGSAPSTPSTGKGSIFLDTDGEVRLKDEFGNTKRMTFPEQIVGALVYQGTWNAATNTPTLSSGVGTKGYYYKVSVAGTTDLDGITDWTVGDSVIFNGSTWDKLEGGITSAEITAALGGTPILAGGALGTPISGNLSNCSAYPAASLSGLGSGVAAALAIGVGSPNSFVKQNGVLGTPSSGTLTNCSGLPLGGVSGFGTGVAAALAIATGSAGAFVTFNGDIGTPSSGTVTNLTGTASININGTVGATTPSTGAFTTLTTSGNATLGDASGDSVTINASTVACANGLNFDSNTFVIDATNNRVGVGTAVPSNKLDVWLTSSSSYSSTGVPTHTARLVNDDTSGTANYVIQGFVSSRYSSSWWHGLVDTGSNYAAAYVIGHKTGASTYAEVLRIDASGNVGIGTSAPTTIPSGTGGLLAIGGAGSSSEAYSTLTLFDAATTDAYATGGIHFGSSAASTNKLGAAIYGVNSGTVTTDANQSLAFYTRGSDTLAERMRLDSSGKLLVGITSATTNGGKIETSNGITFPASFVGCANANTLDDYEEGTFTSTLVIEGTTTAGSGTYSVQQGSYTKIGRLVTVNGYLVWSAHTGTGNIRIAGLPFTSSTKYQPGRVIPENIALTAGCVMNAYVQNATTLTINQIPTGGGAPAAVPMDTSGGIMFSITYEVA